MSTLSFYNELNKRLASIESEFISKALSNNNEVDYHEERQHLMDLINATSYEELSIAKSTPETIVSAFLDIAIFGLSICSKKQLAFIIPKFETIFGHYCHFYIGYKGYLKLASRNPRIKITTSDLVYSKDAFTYNGSREYVTHRTKYLSTATRGEVMGGYCTTELTDGTVVTTVMSPEELFEIEAACRANPNSSWNSPFIDEYRKKTLIRRHWKTLTTLAQGVFDDELSNNILRVDTY